MKLASGAESLVGSSSAYGDEPASLSLAGRFALAFIGFYRRWLSPLKGAPSCRYLPTCSEYALVAVRRHGAAKGSALAAARILRCNPFFHAGFHPVPDAGRWVACEHEGPH
jgi:uncharacterized protein